MNLRMKTTTALVSLGLMASPAFADMEAAKAFLDAEIGDLSTLSRAEQEAEMQWFIDAAQPFAGMEIKVVSETIDTHSYESKVLAPAFTAITGIKVTHDLIGEGDVVEKLQTQMQSGENIYDGYVNDSDLIGTHWRYQQVRNLTDWMAGEGADVTSPTLDIDDFVGLSFTTGPDGKVYQLPTQQFANLYWFRYDWFNDDKNKADFKEKYGYDLGVPVNWSAYEDIAEFFTGRDLSHLGVEGEVFGNMDYGKKDPSLGWRYTDAWMSMAGMGDKGEPNGLPVDEWGIRVNENSQPVGSCVARGGATNSPAAVYAVTKAIEWLQKYSPPAAAGMTFSEAGPIPAQGNVAQQMFWYTAFTAASVKPDLHAQVAHGPLAARRLLGRGHESGLPGCRVLDPDAIYPRGPRQSGVALCAVRDLENRGCEKGPHRPHLHPRVDHPARELYRACAETGRSCGILPLARARAVVAHRHQRARLSETGTALVAEHRRRHVGRQNPARGA